MIVTRYPMNRATSVLCVLSLLFYLVSRASGDYELGEMSSSGSNDASPRNDFGSCTDGKCIKRTTEEFNNGMWFGPRLGKRRRSDEKTEINAEAIQALANALDDSTRWTIVKTKEDDSGRSMHFIPRLGRESGEFLSYEDAADSSNEDNHLFPYFAPRLGRRPPWTPRLGRQLHSVLRKL